jgi:hypothetical protein
MSTIRLEKNSLQKKIKRLKKGGEKNHFYKAKLIISPL